MRATFTDEQHALQQVVADLAMAGRPGHPRAREAVDEHAATTRSLLDGFAGLGIPDDAGGVGGGLVDVAILLHELGRHLVPTRFVPHLAATHVAHAAGLDVAPAVDGTSTWTLALDQADAPPGGPWSDLGGTRLRVPHASDADAVVALVGDGDVVVLAGCSVDPEPHTLDLGRPAATVTLDGEVVGRAPGGPAAIRHAWLLGAAELAGIGRGAVELATAYAKERQQFGQPIGRFQGVAHQIADALVAVENAWSLVLYTAWAVDADADDAASAVHLASASASEAAVFAAERCTQVHGGIGITWEALPHLWLRRAVAGATSGGSVAWHRQQAGQLVLAGVTS